jgi:hypothetical protein
VRPAFDLYTTPRSPILEHEIKSMQAYDRSHQTQPQSGSRGLPAPVTAIEPTQHLGEIGRRGRFAHDVGQVDVSKSGTPLSVLDFPDPER